MFIMVKGIFVARSSNNIVTLTFFFFFFFGLSLSPLNFFWAER